MIEVLYNPLFVVVVGCVLLIGLKMWKLLRPRAIRVRIIMPDGRSEGYLTRISREGDIRIGKRSYTYSEKQVTFEGLLKIPTLEYMIGRRAPISRLKQEVVDVDSL